METILDQLHAGAKPADVYAKFMKELDSATKEVEAEEKAKTEAQEKEKQQSAETARNNLINACWDYATAVGWFDEDQEDKLEIEEDLERELKRLEREVTIKHWTPTSFDRCVIDDLDNYFLPWPW